MIKTERLHTGPTSSPLSPRVADHIVRIVEEAGADCAFMLTGGMMMHLIDAFGRSSKIRYYCNHHEQACAMAADAYARRSGKLGVCLATSGPGATNLLTGLVGAYQDSVPVLFLTGQCKRKETIRGRGIDGLRQAGFCDVDIVSIVQSVTKYAVFVDEPRDIRYHVRRAIQLATTGRPGPVLLDLPLDVQGSRIDESELRGYQVDEDSDPSTPRFSRLELQRVLDAVAQATRPLILAGNGVRTAGLVEEFKCMIDRWQVPTVTSMMAKDLLPEDHPLLVGQIGMRGNRGANVAVQSADLILIIGCSLHIQTVGYEGELFAPRALKIQIDNDPALLKREHVGVQWKLQWDMRDYLPVLVEELRARRCSDGRWSNFCLDMKKRYASNCEPHSLGDSEDPSNLYEFIQLLSDEMEGRETILTDAGQPFYVLPQALKVKEGQRFLTPGSLAEMGWALPASIGAAAAAPGTPIIAVIGDGSIQTNIQELQTLAHHKFNTKLFVINNNGYASIRNTQNTFFDGHLVGSTPATGVTLPPLAKLASAYGLPYVLCENRNVAASRIREVLSTNGPVICEVMNQYDQRVMPIVPSYQLADGSMRSKALDEMMPEVRTEHRAD